MSDFVSSVKEIPYAQATVYRQLQDLRNLEALRSRMNDPLIAERLSQQVGKDKAEQFKAQIQNLKFTADSLSAETPLGAVTLAIVERDEPKCIKFEAQGSPIPLNMWIQLLPNGDAASRLRLTIRAELNFFIRKMVEGKLQSGVEQLAEILAHIPYGGLDTIQV
ncbi:MAG: SRPBCC family protein [Bacteroidaceae bacterium]|nr:SRPBCC family protein [Bacteroidaceae bacterium]